MSVTPTFQPSIIVKANFVHTPKAMNRDPSVGAVSKEMWRASLKSGLSYPAFDLHCIRMIVCAIPPLSLKHLWLVLSLLQSAMCLKLLYQTAQDSLQSFVESSPPPSNPDLETPIPIGRIDRVESAQIAASDIPQPIPPTGNFQQLSDGYQIPTPSRWNETVLAEQNSSERQTAMLRFRYQIVPWLDSNPPGSTFGPKIMTLAAENAVIMDVIIWVAMRRSGRTISSTNQDGESHVIQQFQHRLSLENIFIADVGRSLLALGNFFYACPSEWGSLLSDYIDVTERCQVFENKEEPLKTLDRFHFKTGIFQLRL